MVNLPWRTENLIIDPAGGDPRENNPPPNFALDHDQIRIEARQSVIEEYANGVLNYLTATIINEVGRHTARENLRQWATMNVQALMVPMT